MLSNMTKLCLSLQIFLGKMQKAAVPWAQRLDDWWASRESNTAPTDYAYQLRLSPPLSSLWSGLSLVFTTCPYSLYTFSLARASFGIATACARGFPEFEQFYLRAELTYSKATLVAISVLTSSLRRTLAKSAALTKHELEALKLLRILQP
jgi:hypothetical protein